MRQERVAFVLSGGATHGAVQVGMLQALLDAGVRPDLLVATSVGAMNAAMFSSDASKSGLDTLRELWISAPRSQIFPVASRETLRHLRSRDGHLFPNDGLRRWIESNLRYRLLEHFPIPLHVMVTDVETRTARQISHGDALTAILASSSLPGVFPPVARDGRMLADGGTTADIPVAPAILLGATQIYVLSPRTRNSLSGESPHRGPRTRRFNEAALNVLDAWFGAPAAKGPYSAATQFRPDLGPDLAEVIHLPSPFVADTNPFSFRHSRRLIDEAFTLSLQMLADNDHNRPIQGRRHERGTDPRRRRPTRDIRQTIE